MKKTILLLAMFCGSVSADLLTPPTSAPPTPVTNYPTSSPPTPITNHPAPVAPIPIVQEKLPIVLSLPTGHSAHIKKIYGSGDSIAVKITGNKHNPKTYEIIIKELD
jgi:hypothetical protein